MEIEGIKAEHTQITPNCRLKGDKVAVEEALDVIRKSLLELMDFPTNERADFNIVLSVKRPARPTP